MIGHQQLLGTLGGEVGVFGADQSAEFDAFYRQYGFATLRGVVDDELLAALEAECIDAQAGVVDGRLPERFGTARFLEIDGAAKAEKFANYVQFITEVSPATRAAVLHPAITATMRRLLGNECWLLENRRSGVIYQDARPGRESGYTRIGWHSDWQSAPSQPMWPSTAFTLHVDGTSPANGFLRVVPGSHLWATPAPYENVNGAPVPEGAAPAAGYTDQPPPFPMPLGFEKVPGEIAVYLERGDVLFHDAYLWHSAARATDDATARRHVRGSWYTGIVSDEGVEEFVKNAAR
jgi:ectoine hydroxylase-related dioxygenase (phytanoyl-CoA dioxygenase family)